MRIEDLPEMSDRLLAAEFFGISVPTLARWAVEGKGPRITKIGRAVRYRRADILDFIEKGRQATGGAA